MRPWAMRFIASLLLLGTAHAADPAMTKPSWKQTLATFSDSTQFKSALESFISTSEDGTLTSGATALLRHLTTTGLSYTSTDDLMAQIADLLRETPGASLALEHLVWVSSVLNSMAETAPRSRSVRLANAEAKDVLNVTQFMLPQEALMALIEANIGSHLIERKHLEELVGVPVSDQAFPTLALRSLAKGSLTPTLKRLLLGNYLNLRQFFTPTLRQAKDAAIRLAPSGDRDVLLRRARRYANPRNFVRNGWSQDEDMMRIASGDMVERVYVTTDSVSRPQLAPKIERNIILCVDSTLSMNYDSRGQLRDLIIPSYVDQIFSQAKLRNESVTVYIVYYADKVLKTIKVDSFSEAVAHFENLGLNEFSIPAVAYHAQAMIEGMKAILKAKSKISHLNVVLLTDGEENVDISELKQYTDQISTGPDGLRLGIGAISLVTGEKTVSETIKAISHSDARFLDTAPPMQFFDSEMVRRWTSNDWTTYFIDGLRKPIWAARAEHLNNLNNLLRQININEIDPLAASKNAADDITNNDQDQNSQDESAGSSGDTSNSADKKQPDEKPQDKSNQTDNDNQDTEHESEPQDPSQNKERSERLDSKLLSHNWSIENRRDTTVLYKINLINGTLPAFLAVATEVNMPLSLSQGFGIATQTGDIIPIRLSADVQRHDLAVEAVVPTKISKGLASIAKPDGYTLMGLKIIDGENQTVQDYKIHQIARNGLYLINFGKHKPRRNTFRYQAYYVREANQNKRSPLFDNMNKAALANVSQLLSVDLLTRTALTVNRLARGYLGVKVEDITVALRDDAKYTFTEESQTAPSTNGLFAKYQKFLVDGQLHYQCNGATPLLTDIISSYASLAKNSLAAENVLGYSVIGPTVAAAQGHVVTFVSDRRTPFSYLKLDATPTRMDRAAMQLTRPNDLIRRILHQLQEQYQKFNERVSRPIKKRYQALQEKTFLKCRELLSRFK